MGKVLAICHDTVTSQCFARCQFRVSGAMTGSLSTGPAWYKGA